MVDRLLQLLEIDPGLGGMITFGFRAVAAGRRIPPHAALTGYRTPWGFQPGVLDADGRLIADLDILPPEAQAVLAQRLDQGGCTLVASCHDAPWAHLVDRVAFLVAGPVGRAAKGRRISGQQAIGLIAVAAAELGVVGHRADLFALRAADAIRQADGRSYLCEGDITEAIALVLAPRATAQPGGESEPPPQEQEQGPDDQAEAPPLPVPVAPLPTPAVKSRACLHGAPVRSVAARRKQGTLDLVGTLLAALPWQRLRGADALPPRLLPQDLRWHLRRPKQGRLIIFAVDGSGSMGPRRLGQAKGAVLRLLQQAYRSRDQVALVTVAGPQARLLLPPARAVEQARRQLVSLPAGGATPLASALLMVHQMAVRVRLRDGRETHLVLLTDGRANQPLPGGSRAHVRAELRKCSLLLRKASIRSTLLAEPGTEATELAHWLGANLQPMARGLRTPTQRP